MNINFTNKDEINNLYIHDSIFRGFSYDYDKRQIHFKCDNSNLKKRFYFEFNNTVFFSVQSCSFWHGGNSVLDVFIEEHSPQLEELSRLQNQQKELYRGSYLDRGISYLPIKFMISSGDTLSIICESINCYEETF